MRRYKIIVLSLLFLIGIFIAAIESSPGQRWMQKKLLEALARSGIHVEGEQLSGHFPQTIDLKNGQIHVGGTIVRVKQLHLELSLFPLLQKELSVKKLTAEGVRFEQMADREGKSDDKLPFALTVHSFQIQDFEWPSQPTVSLE
jgi:autotransporter translocation and assembly factor TamB